MRKVWQRHMVSVRMPRTGPRPEISSQTRRYFHEEQNRPERAELLRCDFRYRSTDIGARWTYTGVQPEGNSHSPLENARALRSCEITERVDRVVEMEP